MFKVRNSRFAAGVGALAAGAAALPMVAAAQVGGNLLNILDLIEKIISRAIPLLVAIALIYFIVGLIRYVINAGDGDAREEGKKMMLWGIIALFVIVSIWGIVAYLGSIFNISQGGSAPIPVVPLTSR